MTTLKEVKRSVNAALKEACPGIKVYGADTLEGYERPAFFVYVTQTFSEATKNAVHKNVEIEVDFVQKSPDESEAMGFFAEMERLFCHKLVLPSRQLTTSGLYTGFDGENKNIPVFSFEVEFWDEIDKKVDDTPLAGELQLGQEVKAWDCQS